ncbi:16275_t:CDS:1, partial [Racocetra persica]
MDTNYSDYITPTGYDYYGMETQSEKSKYVYYINVRTRDNVASFAKNKTIYEHFEGYDSEEQQELRGKEIKRMITYYDSLSEDLIKKNSVVHIYIVLRQERKYCGMRSFAEICKPDSSKRFGFTRDVEVIASNETGEEDMNSNNKPSDILPMALLTLSDTLEFIKTNPLLERYGENKCYWVHIKHPMLAIYFTREINYMDFFGCNSKNGGELKYTNTIENIHAQLKKHDSVIKGDIDFYEQKNDIDEATLAFIKKRYAFVPDLVWLSNHKKTKKYTKKSLVGTNISTLVGNQPSKHTREIVNIENERE